MAYPQKMTGVSLTVTERAKKALDRQAAERGLSSSQWAGQVFDIGFAAVCAREKSMPLGDGDLDAICGATLLLRAREKWNTAALGKALGVPEATIERILDGWRDYRRGQDAARRKGGGA